MSQVELAPILAEELPAFEVLDLRERLLKGGSGGMLEVTSLAKHAGISRPTAMAWLDVLQITHAAHLIRPYAQGGRREILAQPKLYGFDTGFVCFARGWDTLRTEDCGLLWEHLVLDTLRSIPIAPILFWRNKQQHQVDFVMPRGRTHVDIIECKWTVDAFDPRGLSAFRDSYPKGRNLVVSPQVTKSYIRRHKQFEVEYVPIGQLRQQFGAA